MPVGDPDGGGDYPGGSDGGSGRGSDEEDGPEDDAEEESDEEEADLVVLDPDHVSKLSLMWRRRVSTGFKLCERGECQPGLTYVKGASVNRV